MYDCTIDKIFRGTFAIKTLPEFIILYVSKRNHNMTQESNLSDGESQVANIFILFT